MTKEMNGGVFFVGFGKGVICVDSSPCPERAPLRDCRQQFILKFINVNVFVVYSLQTEQESIPNTESRSLAAVNHTLVISLQSNLIITCTAAPCP